MSIHRLKHIVGEVLLIACTGTIGLLIFWRIVAFAEDTHGDVLLRYTWHLPSSCLMLVLAALLVGSIQGVVLRSRARLLTVFLGWIVASVSVDVLAWTWLGDYDLYELMFLSTLDSIIALPFLLLPLFATWGFWNSSHQMSNSRVVRVLWLMLVASLAVTVVQFNALLFDQLPLILRQSLLGFAGLYDHICY